MKPPKRDEREYRAPDPDCPSSARAQARERELESMERDLLQAHLAAGQSYRDAADHARAAANLLAARLAVLQRRAEQEPVILWGEEETRAAPTEDVAA